MHETGIEGPICFRARRCWPSGQRGHRRRGWGSGAEKTEKDRRWGRGMERSGNHE